MRIHLLLWELISGLISGNRTLCHLASSLGAQGPTMTTCARVVHLPSSEDTSSSETQREKYPSPQKKKTVGLCPLIPSHAGAP